MTASQPEARHDLFVMRGGGAAAPAGLTFVAVPLRHEAMLEIPALPALAARTLADRVRTDCTGPVALKRWRPVTRFTP
ncbi:hypothetical protein D1781_06925 [Amnibacterium setariae]|uniref:Uncharacterized protein n=1 Tax=Amnibacterium setariae TaxID=2306585 RepID=A0A3A1U6L8_9MICO|nr:hypothetical protein D1781_06925 [Amnibacterium setariae]